MIQVSSLSWRPNSNTKQILSDVSFSLEEGELLVLIGANGSGKSSLLRCLSGWIKPSSGSVEINDKPVHEYSSSQRAEWIALLPQRVQLSENISIKEWLGYARFRFTETQSKRRQKIRSLLQEQGLEALSERSWAQLSGGEAQRCAMLALMAQEARIWLLDEPANHLDPKIQQDVYQGLISQWNTGTTMVLITHNINLLLRSVPDKYKHKVRILGIHEGYIQFDAALSSPELAAQISKLYQLPVETISAFGFSQLIFGQGEK